MSNVRFIPLVRFLRVVSLIACSGGSVLSATPVEDAAQVRSVVEKLAQYHGSEAVVSQRRLRFVYFVPSDRTPAVDYRARLTRVVEESASFFHRELQRLGFKPKPMQLDRAEDGLLRFIVVQGREPWQAYNTKEWSSAKKVQDECRPVLQAAGVELRSETIALFSAIMEYDETRRRFRQRAPYRGSGDADHGFCWQIDAPPLDPAHFEARTPLIDDGEFGRISLGDWNSKLVSGVIHELGHALGLPHNMERPHEAAALGTSLMGSGNRTYGRERRGEGLGTFLTLADAMRLASHPFFTGSQKGLGPGSTSHGQFGRLTAESAEDGLVIRGRVESTPPTYGIVAYTDAEGRGDYDALTTTTVPDADGNFRLHCSGLQPGKLHEVRLVALQVNGRSFRHEGLPFAVSRYGIADVDALRTAFVLAPVVAALREGRSEQARALASELKADDPAREFAAPMFTPPAQRAARVGDDVAEWSLCELKPERASVGWRKPAYDYSPEDLLVYLKGRLERRFIYAHAPSEYAWTLDGTWKRFTATCALGDGFGGTVVFVVKVDGKERWRSRLVKSSQQERCDVDLRGGTRLELVVEEGGDDFHQDHGFWFAPTLSRK